jgi:hypothetical protein
MKQVVASAATAAAAAVEVDSTLLPLFSPVHQLTLLNFYFL